MQITGRRHTPDLIRALTDGDGYRAEVAERTRRFTERYPAVLRLTLIVGAGVMAVLGVAAWLLPDAKATMLGLWALWCLIIIAFLVTLEYVKQSIEQAAEIGEMPDAELREALVVEGAGDRLPVAAGAAASSAHTAAFSARTAVREHPDVETQPEESDTVALEELFAEDASPDDTATAVLDAEPDTPPDADPAEERSDAVGDPADDEPGAARADDQDGDTSPDYDDDTQEWQVRE